VSLADEKVDVIDDVKVDETGAPVLGKRVFKRPKLRILSEKTGKPIEPEKLWVNLVKVADLEHATGSFAIGGNGKKASRPKTILCKDCRTVVVVPKVGGKKVPSRCKKCRAREYRAKNAEKLREYRAKNAEKRREQHREYRAKNAEKDREYRAKNPEKRREQHRVYRAKKKAKATK
jgi:hypothetical protein